MFCLTAQEDRADRDDERDLVAAGRQARRRRATSEPQRSAVTDRAHGKGEHEETADYHVSGDSSGSAVNLVQRHVGDGHDQGPCGRR